MFSRCYCVKLNPLRYQHVSLLFPLLSFTSRISMIRQASTKQLDSLPISQQWVPTEHNKFSSQTRRTKTIMVIISLKGWKKSFHLFRFLWLYTAVLLCLGSSGKQEEESSSFLPHLRDIEEQCFILSINFLVFSVNNRKPNQTSADPVIHYETLYLKKNPLLLVVQSLQLSR